MGAPRSRRAGSRRRIPLALTLALLAATVGARAASGQDGALPADVGAAIRAAIEAGEAAARNAALSASIADKASQSAIAERTRTRIQQSAIAEAVIDGIARHPGSVAAIVRAAVQMAPAHRAAIAYRADLAFPAFAPAIAAAAGTAVLPAPPAVARPAPAVARPQPAAAPAPTRIARAAAARPPARRPPALEAPDLPELLGISQLRIGIAGHDTGVFGRSKEEGSVVMLDVRFAPLTGGVWDAIWQPRPHVGANINTAGDTSAFYLGMTWDWDVWGPVFITLDLGFAVHNGETTTLELGKKELGSRALFRQALELGYRFLDRHAVSVRLDHISNASLTEQNEGLDTFGVVYGYSF